MAERHRAMTPIAPFTERFARVRCRLVSSLESKIDHVYTTLPKLTGEGAAVTAIVGVSPSVGFIATSRVARIVENILVPAKSSRRELKSDEIVKLMNALQVLR
jgi:hypothetical protein